MVYVEHIASSFVRRHRITAGLNAPYLDVDDEDLRHIESELTIVSGRVVYGSGDFADPMSGLEEIQPGWLPLHHYGRYQSAGVASP